MFPIDLHALTRYVCKILSAPQASPPATGEGALDRALEALAQRRRDGQPLDTHRLGFWDVPPAPCDVRGS